MRNEDKIKPLMQNKKDKNVKISKRKKVPTVFCPSILTP